MVAMVEAMVDIKMPMPWKISCIPTTISVGIYSIKLIADYYMDEGYSLPEDSAQFLMDEIADRSEWNMMYIIIPREEFAEPEGDPVAGFEEGPMPYHIYKEATGNYLWIRKDKDKKNCLAYRISKNWSIWELIYDNSKGSCFSFFTELAYIFPYSVLNKGGIMFHGVVMEWQAMGIIVSAHSGVGKSTHTGMWKEFEGALILNGDRALCCREKDTWYTYGAPWDGSSKECLNRKTALKAIVLLEQSEVNQVMHLPRLQSSLELISLTFAPSWEPELMNYALDMIDDITLNVPVIKLKCRPDKEAVSLLKHEVEKLYIN